MVPRIAFPHGGGWTRAMVAQEGGAYEIGENDSATEKKNSAAVPEILRRGEMLY